MKLKMLFFLFLAFAQVSAQKQSTWKLITAGSVYDDGTFYAAETLKKALNTNRINDVAVGPDGTAYIATNIGLFSYSGSGKITKIKEKQNPISTAFAVEFDSQDNLWIASAGRLIKYKNGTFESFTKKIQATSFYTWNC